MAIITSTHLPARERNGAGDDKSLFHPVWHRSAPGAVARAEGWHDGSQGWKSWSAHLAKRTAPLPAVDLLASSSKTPQLAWGMAMQLELVVAPLPTGLPAAHELVRCLERTERRRSWTGAMAPVDLALAWLAEARHRRCRYFPLECLAWCRALPTLAGQLPASVWWQLYEAALAEVEGDDLAEVDVLGRQWLKVELPLTLAYLFPELVASRQLRRTIAAELLVEFDRMVMPDGMPVAAAVAQVRPLVASWVRSRALARELKKSCWSDELEDRLSALLEQSLRLTRRDGTTAFSPDLAAPADAELYEAALADVPAAHKTLARHAIPNFSSGGRNRAIGVPAAANNETAGVAVLRPSWEAGAERLTVTYSGAEVRSEFAVGRDVLWSGRWTLEVRAGGQWLQPEADAAWEEVCWSTDKDMDYLEIELSLGQGVRVQRQMLLGRKDRFLYLADAVLGAQPGVLEYRSVLPLTGKVAFDASSQTREGYLVGRKPRALAFPLGLAEWREQPCGGELVGGDEGLGLMATSQPGAQRLYAPLFFDLDPRRMVRPATWRRLTVAESRKVVQADEAVGYRVQCGKSQWLIYRSLDARGNRTLLGQNLVSEFMLGRFDSSGELTPLLEIE